ncbi:MAG: YceI family protein [Elusimicrobia bacterium]|nr:YceI family protein [Elusimicrobiota bacterium]
MRARKGWPLMIAVALAAADLALAASASLAPGSRLWLEGDSSLHPYSSTATAMEFSAAFGPGAPRSLPEALESQAPAEVTVRIPVGGLKSAHGRLDKNLRKALKDDRFPDIVFVLTDYRVAKGSAAIVARGDLTVAGEKRPVTIEASLRVENGRVVIEGRHALRMTDFKVKPPTMMLGAIKTDDRVVVKFHLELLAGETGGER